MTLAALDAKVYLPTPRPEGPGSEPVSERRRAVGGVWMHLLADGHRMARCGFKPAYGWAEPESRDRHRNTCRECIRFEEMERDSE